MLFAHHIMRTDPHERAHPPERRDPSGKTPRLPRVGWAALALACTPCLKAADLSSPDGRIRVFFEERDRSVHARIEVEGRPLLDPSPLGPIFAGSRPDARWSVTRAETTSHDATWTPVYGKRARIEDRYHALALSLACEAATPASVTLLVRAYNDGVAFRYALAPTAQGDRATLLGERTRFVFHGDPAWWNYRVEQGPEGPRRLAEIAGATAYPLVAPETGAGAVALLEADLREHPWAVFAPGGEPAGWGIEPIAPLPVALPFETPWRVLLIGRALGDLIDADLVANLNPRPAPGAYDWVRPGLCFWDWRAGGFRADDGFVYAQDLPSWKRFIDFAAETGVPHLLIDGDWYGPEFSPSSDPVTGGQAAAVREAIAYGRTRGVGVLLYLNDVAARRGDLDGLLATYAGWGAVGVKYGFMRIDSPIEKVRWTRRVVELCARHRLLVTFHDDPVPSTGEEATFPNFVQREFCHAQSDARRSFGPGDFVRMAQVNMLAGPLDMNNGYFDLSMKPGDRPKVFADIPSTILAEAARTLITYGGGLTVLPDAADAYRRHADLFRFIRLQRPPWAESRTLDSRMGEHLVLMRRAGDTYLVAAATDERERTLTIGLDFLPPGRAFAATIFADAPDSHHLGRRDAYVVTTRRVTAADRIEARLAPGSGQCLILEPSEGTPP